MKRWFIDSTKFGEPIELVHSAGTWYKVEDVEKLKVDILKVLSTALTFPIYDGEIGYSLSREDYEKIFKLLTD
jgi:hypothetical protein